MLNPFVITPDDPNSTANGFVSVTKKVVVVEKPVYDQNAKTALIVDTNVLLKQVHIREMLRIDQETFNK